MQKANAPTKLTVVFASGTGAGPVNNVPLTPGATAGTASYQTGFTSVNMEPIASGGIPPFGADFNGILKNATTAQIWNQAGYMWPFDSAFAGAAAIGGYPAGSVVGMASGKGFWINQADNNSANPDAAGSAGWVGLPAAGTSTISTTGGTTTPDPSVLGVTTLLVSGALTANAVIVLPLTAGSHWIVANNTTGTYTLTVQGASGAGVSITQGSALTVFTDGAAYYAASANISGQYLPINGTAVAATKLATARAFSITGLATASAINFDGTGNVTFNVNALNVAGALGYTPANDASVVHIAGAETITGQKTFSLPTTVNNGFFVQANGQSALSTGFGLGVTANMSGGSAEVDFVANWNTTAPEGFNFYTSQNAGTPTLIASVLNGSATFNGGVACTTVQATTSLQAGNGSSGGLWIVNGGGTYQRSVWADSTTLIFQAGSGGTRWVNQPNSVQLASLDASGNFSVSGTFTCTTMNATGSDRRLKRNIRKFKARPLHRTVPFVSYVLKENGWHGLGSIAQKMQETAPEHVGEFDWHGKARLSLNYAGAAYEQAMWDGQEIDRLTKRIEKLERSRLPRKAGFLKTLLEKVW